MGILDLITVERDEYVSNPDAYWESRGGWGYPASLKESYRRAVPIQKQFYRHIIDRTHPHLMMDFGCGAGKHFDVWQGIPRVVAYDRSKSMIMVSNEVQHRLGTGYNVILGNSNDRVSLPFDDARFDFIAACEVLPHILESEIEESMSELFRTLAPEGVIGAIVSPKNHDFKGHSFNHDYEKLFSDNRFRISYDADFQGYRFLIVEKEGADGQRFCIEAARGHLVFTQDGIVEASGADGKPSAGEATG